MRNHKRGRSILQDGGIYQVTDIEDGIANLKVAPTGKHLAFTVDIKLDDEVPELYKDLPKADARIIDSLMFRHWNAWHDYKYSHLHVAELDDQGRAGQATDLMQDRRVDCPVPPFGGSEQIAWSPDGSQIAFTIKDIENWAESTNSDVFIVDIDRTDQNEEYQCAERRLRQQPCLFPRRTFSCLPFDGKTRFRIGP